MESITKKQMKNKARELKPVAWIGKNGFTVNVKEEVVKQLKSKRLIKIKVLRGYLEESGISKKDLSKQICDSVNAELIQMIGFMLVICRKSKTQNKQNL